MYACTVLGTIAILSIRTSETSHTSNNRAYNYEYTGNYIIIRVIIYSYLIMYLYKLLIIAALCQPASSPTTPNTCLRRTG